MAKKTTKQASKKTASKPAAKKKTVAKKAAPSKAAKITATPKDVTDKAHLVDVIQSHTDSTKTAAKEALDAVLDTLSMTQKKTQKLQILGFGTFEVAKRKARKGRNPATGETIKIKASKTVRFRPGTKLKAEV